jgi:MFS family permease
VRAGTVERQGRRSGPRGWDEGVLRVDMLPETRGLWHNSDFMRMWAGQTVSVFGSLVTRTALPFTAILVLGATPLQMSLLVAAELVPGIFLGLAAGVWVDRMRRRPIMIAADLGRAALLGSVPVSAILGTLRIEQLYVVALLTGALTVFFDVAYRSYLPSLVTREQLIEANSRLTATSSAAEVGAFGLGGWLVELLTAPVAVLIDALSFLISALCMGLIRTREVVTPPEVQQSMRREIVEGLRTVLADPLLRAMAACSLTLEVTSGIFAALILLYTNRELGFQPGVLGLIFAVGGVSSLLGALLAGPVIRRFGIGPAMLLGLILFGVARLFVPLAQDATLVAAALLVTQQLVGDGVITIYLISQVSLRQAITPDRLLGRVNASIQFADLGAMVVGTFLGGLLGEAIGLRPTLVVAACGTFLAALWLAVSPLRELRDSSSVSAVPSTDGGPRDLGGAGPR